jgi:hypothetical protein
MSKAGTQAVGLFPSFRSFCRRTFSRGFDGDARDIRLLKKNLSPAQRAQYAGALSDFRAGSSMNADELDIAGNCVAATPSSALAPVSASSSL